MPTERIQRHLAFLYGEEEGVRVSKRLHARLAEFRARNRHWPETVAPLSERVSERDVVLITYGDQLRETGKPPLRSLEEFLRSHLSDVISSLHLLPFFPYSSDDGFSVINYREVDPELGDWNDISRLREHFRLMFDAVINHVSRQSDWFKAFLRGEQPFVHYFITLDPNADLSMVVRPRALPLLTPVETVNGTEYVWTTFSEDQIDLNYRHPDVLLEMIDVLLFYVEKGAGIIRLDAVAYLWKQPGTPCIHLPQTHQIVKLFRSVLDAVAPHVLLITETNVPHEENISYFGDDLPGLGHTDEAQLVYQFPLALLVLHTFLTADATRLTDWAVSLTPPHNAYFFNFIASHDGVGVMPARGILSESEINALVERTLAHGGQVSYRALADGSRSVYELNISFFDALSDPNRTLQEIDVRRFLASQAILLSLAGVPGIYIHSLLGSRNCQDCVRQTGRPRSINREKFKRDDLERELADAGSLRCRVFNEYRNMLRVRRMQAPFNPNGEQLILSLHNALFALVRTAPNDHSDKILCLINVSEKPQHISFDLLPEDLRSVRFWKDLLTDQTYSLPNARPDLTVAGYQVLWLKRMA